MKFIKEINQAIKILRNSRLVATAGNGGSCANALHLVTDLRTRGIAAIDFCNPCVLTALANDYGARYVFSTQVLTTLSSADTLILFSGSGRSGNILRAARRAKMQNITLISFSQKGTPLEEYSTVYFGVDSTNMEELEDEHARLAHRLVVALDKKDG